MHELSFDGLAPLAVIQRAGLNESFHLGVAALVTPDGALLDSHGDTSALIYPRSALKPIQALAMARSGLSPSSAQRVMTMASHYATQVQVDLIAELLKDHGLSEEQLKCPKDMPWNLAAKAKASEPRSIYMNCSGKHAGFLAASKLSGFELENYLDPGHPIQLRALALVEEFSREKVGHITVDGCGAPLFAVSTVGLARAISGFSQAAKELVAAAIANPNLIGDTTTSDAAFLRTGLFSKLGAEGVFTVATHDGHALAIKIADGSLRAAPAIAVAMLQKHSLITQGQASQILSETNVPVLGGGKPVGELQIKIK